MKPRLLSACLLATIASSAALSACGAEPTPAERERETSKKAAEDAAEKRREKVLRDRGAKRYLISKRRGNVVQVTFYDKEGNLGISASDEPPVGEAEAKACGESPVLSSTLIASFSYDSITGIAVHCQPLPKRGTAN